MRVGGGVVVNIYIVIVTRLVSYLFSALSPYIYIYIYIYIYNIYIYSYWVG